MKKRIHTRKYTVLAVLLLAAAACSKEPGPAPAPTPVARVMVVQPSPYEQPMDVYSVFNDTFKINTTPLLYPGMRQYVPTVTGTRWIYCAVGGTFSTEYGVPKYFAPGGSYTLYNMRSPILQQDDLTVPPDGYAKIRVLQGCPYNRPLNCLADNGDTLAKGISYWGITGFRPVKAGAYVFDLADSNAPYARQASLQTTLEAGRIYTLLVTNRLVADTSRVLPGAELITNY